MATHSGKKVVMALLAALVSTSAAVVAIGASVGSVRGADVQRPPPSSGGGSMWKNIDNAKKNNNVVSTDERKPGAPW